MDPDIPKSFAVVQCSGCGSEDHELVRYRESNLIRCRQCKHEGDTSRVIPRYITTSTIYSSLKDGKPKTF